MASLTAFLQLGLKDNLTKPLKTVAQALKDAEANVKAVAKGMANTGATDRFSASLSKLKLSAKDIEAVSKAWTEYSRSAGLAANASNWTKEQLSGVRSWENQTLSALRRVSAEQRQFFANQNRLSRESRGMFSLTKPLAALGGPMLGMAAGGAMIAAVKEALGLGATLQERVAQLKAAGATPAEIDTARKDFREFAAKHAGVLEADYLATFKDARVIAPAEAFEMAQLGARYRSALRNSGLSTSEEDVGNVMRVMDELGMKGMPERKRFLDSVLRSQQAFGSQIQTETLLAAYRNAKQSIYGWSPEFREKIFPTLLQSAGQQGGTEMMTALNNYIGHHMQKTEIESLVKAGFVRPQDVKTDHGRTTFRDNAQLFEADVFRSNIAQWAWDFHQHYMSRKGATETGFDDLIAKMPRNMSGLIAFLVHNEARVKRDEQTLEKPTGLAAGDDAAMKDNPVSAFGALTDSLKQLAAAATSPLMTKAAQAMTSLAETIQNFSSGYSEWAKNNPEVAKTLGIAGVAGGGVGGWALLNGAFQGMLGGFGLKGSAAALDASADALTAAAGRLGVGGGAGAVPGAAPAAAAAPWVGGFSLAGLATWLGFGLGAAGADVKGAIDYAKLTADERKKARDDVRAQPSLVPNLTIGELQERNRKAFLNFFGLGPGPGNDNRELPYAGQLPPGAFPLRDPALTTDAWRPTPSQRAMAGAYGFTLSDVKPAADEGKAALDALNATVRPQVDTSDITRARGELQAFLDDLARAGSLTVGPRARSVGPPPTLGATVRGSFTYGGVSGE